VLTSGIRIKGELSGKSELLIDGELEGKIRLMESTVTVGASGRVKSDISAREIAVRGKVDGTLRGRERVILGNSSHVRGDLEAPRVMIEDGAVFKGKVEMGRAEEPRQASREIPRKALQPSPSVAPAGPVTPASAPANDAEPEVVVSPGVRTTP
jgi:cytoskeletal protein CcmA (bactofilin family)